MRKRIFTGAFILFSIFLFSHHRFGFGSTSDMQVTPDVDKDSDITYATATFAAGCFWCIEPAYQEEPGVIDAIVGYAGGTTANPSYQQVAGGQTDYREAVQVTFDPEQISYEQILDIFWANIDPTDAGGQFVDRGFQYTTAIFFHDVYQQEQAMASFSIHEMGGKYDEPFATKILPYTTFYPAEEYHQDFYKNSKERYKRYSDGSGRPEYFEDMENK